MAPKTRILKRQAEEVESGDSTIGPPKIFGKHHPHAKTTPTTESYGEFHQFICNLN